VTNDSTQPVGGMNRRTFLKQASAGTAVLSASSHAAVGPRRAAARNTKLATVPLGEYRVTRLIAGYNPIGGHSHLTASLSRQMRAYFTVERTVAFLQHCEELGINTFQFDLIEKTEKALKILWDGGSALQFICLHAERPKDVSIDRAKELKAFALVHHGGVTDTLFRQGKAEKVHDYVKKVHDAGLLAGVSSHCPANIARIADEGWENDLFMTCFHYVTRTREEMEQEFGTATVGEPFVEADPDRMTAVIRQVNQPCLAFKILAAGRRCDNSSSVRAAFKYAFDKIKPTDAVIVGMFPRDADEVQENVDHTLKYGKA